MKRFIGMIPILLALVMAISAPRRAGAGEAPFPIQAVPAAEEARKAAREALDTIRDPKNSEYLQSLEKEGYISRADLERAELGEGFQTFAFLRPNDSLADDAVYDPKTHVVPTREWDFLIYVDGKAKTLLSLGYFRLGNKHSFGIGRPLNMNWSGGYVAKEAARIVEELDGLLSAWPASAGYQHRLISYVVGISPYPKLTRVIELSQDGKVLGFIPLTFARDEIPKGTATARNFTSADLLDPNFFLEKVKSEARQRRKERDKQLNKK